MVAAFRDLTTVPQWIHLLSDTRFAEEKELVAILMKAAIQMIMVVIMMIIMVVTMMITMLIVTPGLPWGMS